MAVFILFLKNQKENAMNSVYKVSIDLMLKQGYRTIRQNKTLVNKSVAMAKHVEYRVYSSLQSNTTGNQGRNSRQVLERRS